MYHTPKNRPPVIRTPNSKSLTEALIVCIVVLSVPTLALSKQLAQVTRADSQRYDKECYNEQTL